MDGDAITLSTGQTVSLPLECRCSFSGAVVTADADRLAAALPPECAPIRVGPGTGLVSLVGIEYHEIGPFEPYREFGAIVPTARNPRLDLPVLAELTGSLGGYVHWLPVTTADSVALGREVWGYPKEVADIGVRETAVGRRITVDRDGERDLGLSVAGTRERSVTRTLDSVVAPDGRAETVPVTVDGAVGVGTGGRVALSFGDGGPEGPLAELGVRRRPIARFSGTDVRATIHAGERDRSGRANERATADGPGRQ